MRLRMLAGLPAVLLLVPGIAKAQANNSMYSNLANPAIGMNALFTGQAVPTLNQPYGLGFDEAEISLLAVVDPYGCFSGNIVLLPDHYVDRGGPGAWSGKSPAVQD